MSDTQHPVIADLRTALGEAIDRQQVEIVRAYLDADAAGADGRAL